MTVQTTCYIELSDLKVKVKLEPKSEFIYEEYDTRLYKKPMCELMENTYNLINNSYSLINISKENEVYFSGKLIYVDDKDQIQIYHSKVYTCWITLIKEIFERTKEHGKYLVEFTSYTHKEIKDVKEVNEVKEVKKIEEVKEVENNEKTKQYLEGDFTGKLIYIDNKDQVQIYHSPVYKGWNNLLENIYSYAYKNRKYLATTYEDSKDPNKILILEQIREYNSTVLRL